MVCESHVTHVSEPVDLEGCLLWNVLKFGSPILFWGLLYHRLQTHFLLLLKGQTPGV